MIPTLSSVARTPLRPYQREAVRFLAARRLALYVADPGLGKSRVALEAARTFDRILIVAPAVSRASWPAEVRKWGNASLRFVQWADLRSPRVPPSGPCILFVSWGELAGARDALLAAPDWDALVVDEAHYAKEPRAARTRALYGRRTDGLHGVVSKAGFIWLLTGTPAPNHYGEVWTHLRALAPGLIPSGSGLGANPGRALPADTKPMSYQEFLGSVCVVQETPFGPRVLRARKGAGKWLRERISPAFMLRHRKVDVANDLPPMSWVNVPLSLPKGTSPGQMVSEFYEAAGGAPPDMDPPQAVDMVFAADQTARMADLSDDQFVAVARQDAHIATARRVLGVLKADPAATWIKDMLDSGVRKVVVFAVHLDVIAELRSGLAAYGCVVVTGGTSGTDRTRAVEAFQSNEGPRVFLGQVQAAGTAITLTAASDVVFVEQSWTPSDNFQAACRAHRLGQKDGVTVHVLHAAGTLDERVSTVLQRKAADLAEAFG